MNETVINPHNELAMPKRNLPRDVFLHLLAMVTLYWSAISFVTLCWQYINYYFPDALDYRYIGFEGPIRFAMASLFIVFPVFIATSWFLNKIYAKESEVRESKIRKWLIYLTLFVAALVIIGDLVYVINTFLGGELTTRFILKALSVLAVAAVVFWYYLDDVRRPAPSDQGKYFAWGSAVAVLVLVAGAFLIVGSPKTARLQQLDRQRVGDLQSIQERVLNYWQRKGELPEGLNDLNDSISGYVAPVDPETSQPYEYTVKDLAALKFELCATFSLEGQADGRVNIKTAPVPAGYPYDGMPQVWGHAAGQACFERTIDKQLYPRITNGK